MLQLTYISTATADLSGGAMGDILAASRRNNTGAGVTGLLLFDGRRFLQALEGESAMVERIYDRIRTDGRHRAVVLLSRRNVDTRAFGDRAMAGQEVARADGIGLVGIVDRLTETVADPTMRMLFRSFAQVRAAA